MYELRMYVIQNLFSYLLILYDYDITPSAVFENNACTTRLESKDPSKSHSTCLHAIQTQTIMNYCQEYELNGRLCEVGAY